jgi:hypothetical protein
MSKFSKGDLVLISDRLDHDMGYAGQIGVVLYIYDYQGNPHEGLSDCSVIAYDARAKRYWGCGFEDKDLTYKGNFLDFIYGYNSWINSNYNKYSPLFFIQTKEEKDKQDKLLNKLLGESEKKKESMNISKVTPLMPVTSVSPYYDKTLILWDKVDEIIRSMNNDE